MTPAPHVDERLPELPEAVPQGEHPEHEGWIYGFTAERMRAYALAALSRGEGRAVAAVEHAEYVAARGDWKITLRAEAEIPHGTNLYTHAAPEQGAMLTACIEGIGLAKMALMAGDPVKARERLDAISDKLDALTQPGAVR